MFCHGMGRIYKGRLHSGECPSPGTARPVRQESSVVLFWGRIERGSFGPSGVAAAGDDRAPGRDIYVAWGYEVAAPSPVQNRWKCGALSGVNAAPLRRVPVPSRSGTVFNVSNLTAFWQ